MRFFNLFTGIQRFFLLLYLALTPPYNLKTLFGLIGDQILDIGIISVPLVLVISAFAGFVTAIQGAYQLTPEIPRYFLGASVEKIMVMELSPVLVGLIVTGRASSSIAAELGAMRATEQIDALEVMAISPVRFLVRPRVIAGAISLPLLTIISIVVALGSALFLSSSILHVPIDTFVYGIRSYFQSLDLIGGLTKSFFFGIILSSLGCFYGLEVRGGAKEISQAATSAVVLSSIMILVFDFLVASLFYA